MGSTPILRAQISGVFVSTATVSWNCYCVGTRTGYLIVSGFSSRLNLPHQWNCDSTLSTFQRWPQHSLMDSASLASVKVGIGKEWVRTVRTFRIDTAYQVANSFTHLHGRSNWKRAAPVSHTFTL